MVLTEIPPFRPFPGLRSPWAQTLAGRFWPQQRFLKEDRLIDVSLEDGDRLVVAENTKSPARPSALFVMLHGLTGCYQSRYMTRLAQKLSARYEHSAVWRVNLRNCGPGFGYSRGIYHSGRSEDLAAVVNHARNAYPNTELYLIGISLGGNITLKYLGEKGYAISPQVKGAISISAPVDLARSAKHLSRPENAFFDKYFVREVVKDIRRLHAKFPDLPHGEFPTLPARLTDLDDLYTAPRGGFKNAADYYEKSSSYHVVPAIQVPTLHICSDDDPVVFSPAYHELKEQLTPSQLHTFAFAKHGGHVGFIGAPGEASVRWLDLVVMRWLDGLKDWKSP